VPLLDTHAHLYDDRFANDLPKVLARAAAAGVVGIVTLGIDLASSRTSVGQAGSFPILRAAVGLQPNSVHEAAPGDWDAIAALAEHPLVAAVGETGLDRYWDRAPFPLQEDYFDRHLELAHRLKKPVCIHCRDAESDVERMLRVQFDRHGPIRGVMHSYCGDAAHAERFVAMGLHVSFAGMLTYKTGASIRAVAQTIPVDRLLVETDAPYLAPVPVRGKRNEPAFVVHTAACLAEIRGSSPEAVEQLTTENARRLFEWPGFAT
jgi:TatD DNase family protein